MVRTSRAAALAVATIVTAAVAVGYVVHDRHHAAAAAPKPAQTPQVVPSTPVPRPSVLGPLDSAAPEPTAAGVTADLAAAVKAVTSGAHLVGEVSDAQTGTVLWSRSSAQPEAPASTTKIVTAAAALDVLGPDHRLTTSTRLAGNTLYLVGGGDPTIVADSSSYVSPTYPRPATLSDLAKQTAADLGATTRVRLRLDSTAWTGPDLAVGWKHSYVTEGDVTPPSALELDEGRTDPSDEYATRTTTPVAQAGAEFATLLEADGVKVVGAVTQSRTPSTATDLAAVQSPPVSALVQRMLTVSDDDLAEALGRAIAIHDGDPATFEGAATAVTTAIQALGISTTAVTLNDTSGLSHRDRIPPQVLIAVLRAAISTAHPALRSLLAGLPIAGLTGTLSTRFLDPNTRQASGVLRAKTGTLTGVNALAGTVVDVGGRQLVFAFLASDASLPGLTVPALDVLASRLVRCGCDSLAPG